MFFLLLKEGREPFLPCKQIVLMKNYCLGLGHKRRSSEKIHHISQHQNLRCLSPHNWPWPLNRFCKHWIANHYLELSVICCSSARLKLTLRAHHVIFTESIRVQFRRDLQKLPNQIRTPKTLVFKSQKFTKREKKSLSSKLAKIRLFLLRKELLFSNTTVKKKGVLLAFFRTLA